MYLLILSGKRLKGSLVGTSTDLTVPESSTITSTTTQSADPYRISVAGRGSAKCTTVTSPALTDEWSAGQLTLTTGPTVSRRNRTAETTVSPTVQGTCTTRTMASPEGKTLWVPRT
nr:hypothetical protein HmN_000960600 [Hymenolepis microstoma]